MSYGNPVALLAVIMPDPMPVNRLGHTPLDDFAHLCSRTGLSVESAGEIGYAWAKLGFVAGWLDKHDGYGGPD
jgi:hypothetical protein